MAITAASIETNGWVLRLTVTGALGSFASYALDPGTTPRLTLTSSHPGFIKSGGQAVAGSMARSLIATKPLRLPVNPASPTTAVIDETDLGGGSIRVRIALSEHVYATDTGLSLAVLAGWRTGETAVSGIGVTNSSTVAAPIPIMRWALVPYGTATGSFTLALMVVSHHPLGFEPVAGVKFTATDGTTVKTIWTTQLSTDTSVGDNLRCYTASIDPATATALTAGLLRCDAEVYPWLGAMRSTDTAGTRSMTSARSDGFAVDAAAPFIIGHDPAGTRYNNAFAFVDPVNGTVTAAAGMIQTTLAGAKAVAAASRPKDINTAIQAGYLANRTLAAANGQAAQTRSVDGLQIVLAAGTHAGSGSTAVTTGIATPEIPVRIQGDPADSNPRANVIIQTGTTAPSRISRVAWANLSVEQGTNTLCAAGYNFADNVTFRGKTGLETNTVSPFSAAAAAGQWCTALTRSKWWRTGAQIAAGNQRVGIVRACEIGRTINGALFAAKNRLIALAEDGFSTAFPLFGAWGAPTIAGQVEDIIIAFNDARALPSRVWTTTTLPAATAGTPNPSLRRQVFIGNVVERIGNDPAPFYGIGEDASVTMSYNIIEGNTFVGDRSNTFYSDPLPTSVAETNTQANQAFVNRVANNAFDWLPTKHDDFADPTTAALRGTSNGYRPQMIEAWSMLYGVGHEANVDTRRTGTNLFQLEYSGLRTVTGYAGAVAPTYVDDRSILGPMGAGATGGGNYRPQAGSPLAGRGVRSNGDVDGDGTIRRVPFSVGAYQALAVDLVPAGARSAQRAGASVVEPRLVPVSARSAQRAGASVVEPRLVPVSARSAQRAGASIVEPRLVPGSARSATRAGVPLLGWMVTIVPVAARQAMRAGTPLLGWAGGLSPLPGRSAMRAAAPALVWAGGLAPVATRHRHAAMATALEPMVFPASSRVVAGGGSARVDWGAVLGPAPARSLQRADVVYLGLAIRLVPAAAGQPMRSGVPAVAIDTVLSLLPANGRSALGAAAPLLFAGTDSIPNAVLIIGSDPRIVFPNRN
ncbi:MAG: hypothetical protein H7267_00980 [Sandarakinorhabdus sp.]|nr:hypothetical protein [Sandarakinorhabdus sp.]